MSLSTLILATALLADTALAHKEKGNDWDPDAGTALEGKVRTMFTQLDTGDLEHLMEWADPTSIVFDVDAEGHPFATYTRDDSRKMLEGFTAAIKKGELTVKTKVNKVQCHSTSSFGFCVMEFDQAFKMGGQVMPDGTYRATLIARQTADGWRWTHWHASPREMSAVMVEPAMKP